ncbi:MAG: hypothetical protein H8Z69_00545 [Nanohaloarchaea archaeon]|nr:hypothetical protein [Candidatus Nanohaloarchaea archaeon]
MSTENLRGSEEHGIATRILEEEEESIETWNKIDKLVLDRPVSHYKCEWASEDYPVVLVWESKEDNPEEPPDYVGCEECGVMTEYEKSDLSNINWDIYRQAKDL